MYHLWLLWLMTGIIDLCRQKAQHPSGKEDSAALPHKGVESITSQSTTETKSTEAPQSADDKDASTRTASLSLLIFGILGYWDKKRPNLQTQTAYNRSLIDNKR